MGTERVKDSDIDCLFIFAGLYSEDSISFLSSHMFAYGKWNAVNFINAKQTEQQETGIIKQAAVSIKK